MKKFIVLSVTILLFCLLLVAPVCFAEDVSEAITAQNTWTDAIFPAYMPEKEKTSYGHSNKVLVDYGTLNLYITGTWVGTVTLQAAYDFGTAWVSTGETFTSNTIKTITCFEPGVAFRCGIGTGDYTSGTCNVRLSK